MVGVRGLVSSASVYRTIVSENQPSDSTKVGKFLDQLRDCQSFEKFSIFRKNVEILTLTATICF